MIPRQRSVSRPASGGCSNLLFGVLHYFTLRWKLQWCCGAFLGGMVLSRQLNEHGDLVFVIALHWIATFINTPRLPGRTLQGVPP